VSALPFDLVRARPVVTSGLIANELGVPPRAAQGMVAELGLRELTGRGRYRAWGLL
jgi:Mn-dependent DtxR family transcriptional regulator